MIIGVALPVDSQVAGASLGPGVVPQVGEAAGQPLFDAFAEPLRAEVVDHELEARLAAGGAVTQVAAPFVHERLGDVQRLRLCDEHAEIARQRGHVEQFLSVEAGDRAAGDVAQRVAAAGARGEPGFLERGECFLHGLQPDAMDLQILPRRDFDGNQCGSPMPRMCARQRAISSAPSTKQRPFACWISTVEGRSRGESASTNTGQLWFSSPNSSINSGRGRGKSSQRTSMSFLSAG